jgi:DNA-binding NarL/FixJ family response regulator
MSKRRLHCLLDKPGPGTEHGDDDENVRIGIVDNDSYALDYMETMMQTTGIPIRVMRSALSGKAALRMCGDPHGMLPDVSLTDLQMSDMSGEDLAAELGRRYPTLRVIGIIAFTEIGSVDVDGKASKLPVLHKEMPVLKIVHVIGEITGNDYARYWDGGQAGRGQLSQTELKVAKQLAFGRTVKAIAVRFGVSETTVKTHMRHIFQKLGVHSKTEAIAACIREGLI